MGAYRKESRRRKWPWQRRELVPALWAGVTVRELPVSIGFWDSVRIDRISPKFTYLGRVRTEFSASKFEYSQKSDKKPTEIDRNSPNSVGTKFFPKLNPKTLLVTHSIWTVNGP